MRAQRATTRPAHWSTDSPPDPDAWKLDGLCRQVDPELWFPEVGGSTRQAKRMCGECPVRTECLEWALTHDERFGIWAGTSELDRRKLRRPGAQPTSRAPHNPHPMAAKRSPKEVCGCGQPSCSGLVGRSTRNAHHARLRRAAARARTAA